MKIDLGNFDLDLGFFMQHQCHKEIERKKMEVREKVQLQLGRVEEETKLLAKIREATIRGVAKGKLAKTFQLKDIKLVPQLSNRLSKISNRVPQLNKVPQLSYLLSQLRYLLPQLIKKLPKDKSSH
ncbi:hypothetical protein J1N35_010170 [Gossypium stocksii]|uniref:Uncharacterized protein n=1 Tax=Gossypium stocksii TaxID=47602 RepID=A0A9D3W0H6_9ROSI|nr:hypothetical protein J1N35_010170 [Gossypium stocksii]